MHTRTLKIVSILTALIFLSFLGIRNIHASGYDSPLSVDITMEKTDYAPEDLVEGTVIITNASGASIPATFDIKLFHDGKLEYDLSTAVESVWPGDNKYSFKDMGIPQIQFSPAAAGNWRLVIIQKNVKDSYAAKFDFTVREKREETRAEN